MKAPVSDLQKNRWPVISNRLFCGVAGSIAALALLMPAAIFVYLIVQGWSVISSGFLFDHPRGHPLGTDGGIRPAIEGSVALTGIGLLLGFPLAILAALFLAEFNRSRLVEQIMRFSIENLAAVPAIIYGLFGYAFAVVALGMGISLASGALTLGILMMPVILIGAHEAFRSVDSGYRDAALSLGVSRGYWVRRILLKKAWPGIVAATVLAAGHATGSAAPILMTASTVFSRGHLSLETPVMTLPTHLYQLVAEAVSFEHAYGVALVLFVGLMLANLCAVLLKRFVSRSHLSA